MSSTLRLSIIMVLLLATAALGLIAYNMNLPKPTGSTGHGEHSGVRRLSLSGTLSRHVRYRQVHWHAKKISQYARCRRIVFQQGRSLIRPTLGSDFAVLWFASSSTLAVPSHHKTYCAREIGVSSPASWHRVAVPSASRLTRSLASRA